MNRAQMMAEALLIAATVFRALGEAVIKALSSSSSTTNVFLAAKY
ncbi:MAG TPA: hypothetical protein VJN90_12900 [Candidatus Acidoferrales bacterium]|nr:hypothetical protein [Candidatus Acidoferrales bacterium]